MELFPMSDMLTIGWYYGFNPGRKPIKGTVMPVCKFLGVIDTPVGKRCIIKVIGDIDNREVYSRELSPMTLVGNAEINNFSSAFSVPEDQLLIWKKLAK